MTQRAQRLAPVRVVPSGARIEDWLLASVFGLFPLLGLTLSRGDALTLFGIGILVWVGHRALVAHAAREAYRSLGLTALLVMLSLTLPGLEAGSGESMFPGDALARWIRFALLAVLLIGAFRGKLRWDAWTRRADLVMCALVAAVGILVVASWSSSHAQPMRVLGEITLSLAIVYGVRRVHLIRSRALPMLTRTALVGVFGAFVVAMLRG